MTLRELARKIAHQNIGHDCHGSDRHTSDCWDTFQNITDGMRAALSRVADGSDDARTIFIARLMLELDEPK
jgi:hypothetical protein